MRPPAPLLLPLAGFALGLVAVWTFRPLRPADAPGSADVVDKHAAFAAFLPPARLAPPEAADALSAYLALPPIPADATQAEFLERASRLRALLTLLPAEHLAQLLAATAVRRGDPEARLRQITFTVWTELDAPAAARWAAALAHGDTIDAATRARYLTEAALAWSATAFDAAYAWATSLPDSALGADLARQLLARLAATDPVRAVALARAAGDEFFKASQKALFFAWAEHDPAAAIQTLGPDWIESPKIPAPFFVALRQWFARDPQSAFAWIIAQPVREGDSYNRLLYSACARLGDDPVTARAAADLLLAHPELSDQLGGLGMLASCWTRQNPSAVLTWLDGLADPRTRNHLIEQCIGFGNAYDLPIDDFLAFARRLPEGRDRDEKIAGRIDSWASQDPERALAWLSAHESPDLAPVAARVQGTLLARLAQTNPAAALAKWQSLPAGPDQSAAVGPLAQAWAKTDPVAAARWLTAQLPALSSSAEKSKSVVSLGSAWAQTDAPSAIRWMSEQLATLPATPDASGIDQARGSYQYIARRFAHTAPSAALQLAATTPDPSVRKTIYNTLAYEGSYSGTVNPDAPTLSRTARADLVATIPDATDRTSFLTALLGNWLRQDFHAASAWIDSHDVVAPELAARLITQADPSAP
jgi:hypothetical protein